MVEPLEGTRVTQEQQLRLGWGHCSQQCEQVSLEAGALLAEAVRCRYTVLVGQHTPVPETSLLTGDNGDTGAAGLRGCPPRWVGALRGAHAVQHLLECSAVHRLPSSIDPGLSYLNEPWPRASARKTFHLTSAIRAVTQRQGRSSAAVMNVLTPLCAALGLPGCLWRRMADPGPAYPQHLFAGAFQIQRRNISSRKVCGNAALAVGTGPVGAVPGSQEPGQAGRGAALQGQCEGGTGMRAAFGACGRTRLCPSSLRVTWGFFSSSPAVPSCAASPASLQVVLVVPTCCWRVPEISLSLC